MRHLYRQGARVWDPEIGTISLYIGIFRRKIRHVHLTSPDGQTNTCVPVKWLKDVLYADDWYDAVRIARHGPDS